MNGFMKKVSLLEVSMAFDMILSFAIFSKQKRFVIA